MPTSSNTSFKTKKPIFRQLFKLSILALVALLLTPIITTVLYVFQPSSDVWQHLVDTVLAEYVTNSLILAFGVALLALIIGVSTAWFTSMYVFPGHRVLPLLLMLPFAMPAYIIAFTYTGMLDSGGVVQHYLREWTGLAYGEYWFPEIRNIYGAIFMLGFVLYPYVFLMARASFLSGSVHALQVGQTLGLTPMQRFYRIALPLSRPAIIAGLALVIMETLADYGTVQYFGVSTFTTGIFRTWYGLDDLNAAINLSALLLFAVLIFFGIEMLSRSKIRYSNNSKSATSVSKKALSKPLQFAMLAWCMLPVLVGFAIPAFQLSLWAFDNLAQVDKDFLMLCWRSFYLALLTATLAVVVAFVIFAYQRYYPSKSVTYSFRMVALGYAIPGIVVAIGVLVPAGILNQYLNQLSLYFTGKSVGLIISSSLMLLVFAYLVRFMAIALGSMEAGFGKINNHIDDAARSLNTSSFAMMLKIHAPMMFKTILTAVLIIFIDTLKELPTTLVLRPFNFNTLAVNAFELASDEFLDEAALPAIFIVLTGIVPVVLLNWGIGSDNYQSKK